MWMWVAACFNCNKTPRKSDDRRYPFLSFWQSQHRVVLFGCLAAVSADALDIGRWRLDDSKGDDSCTVPAGVVLAPGAGCQVATGDCQPKANGIDCGAKPIWNNGGETIFLHGTSGLVLSIESVWR